MDRIDGQRGRDGLPDPARAGHERRHVRADRNVDDHSFVNSGLTANTTFRYQVRATDAAGNVSAVSNTVTATTQTGGTGGGCSLTPTVQTQWQTGYVIEPARVTNTGTATINSWTVTFTCPRATPSSAPGTRC